MDRIGTRRVGMAAIAFLTGFCFAETKDSGTHFAEEAVLPYIQKGECPGAISIFYKDGVQETACMGWADVDKKIPMTLDKMFMQCSQTKGFCGVTIAMLVEEGKLSLDDPVHKYLPEFKTLWIQTSDQDGVRTLVKAKNVLTVKDVMNHTGGFPFEIPSKSVLGWPGVPLRVTAAEAAACPIFFEPGTKERYSNTGIDIGAAIVEVITGKKWDVFLKERVLDPLGMTDSTFNPTDEQLARSIQMYDLKKDQPAAFTTHDHWMPLPHNGPDVYPSAGAGLWTTAADQLKFYKMLMNLGVGDNGVRILKEETVKNLLAKNLRPANLGCYSLGLAADSGDGWFGHGGAWGTNCSVNWKTKQLKLWVVQYRGGPRPWEGAKEKAAQKFFASAAATATTDAYTGRLN